jgi:hypothetical protein
VALFYHIFTVNGSCGSRAIGNIALRGAIASLGCEGRSTQAFRHAFPPAGPQTDTMCRYRRRHNNCRTYVDNTAKLRSQASVLAPRPCTCNAQLVSPRATACTPRSNTCVAQRASSWHHDQVPATHNERRRKQRPEHHGQEPCEFNAGAFSNWAKAHVHKSWA